MSSESAAPRKKYTNLQDKKLVLCDDQKFLARLQVSDRLTSSQIDRPLSYLSGYLYRDIHISLSLFNNGTAKIYQLLPDCILLY